MTNVLPPAPSSTQLRAMLEQMVLKDLLGLVGGNEEKVDEPSVRDRYLVGMMAPKRQELSPEQFDDLPTGGSGTSEDGPTEVATPAAKTMFPSSFQDTGATHLHAPGNVDGFFRPYPRERGWPGTRTCR